MLLFPTKGPERRVRHGLLRQAPGQGPLPHLRPHGRRGGRGGERLGGDDLCRVLRGENIQ